MPFLKSLKRFLRCSACKPAIEDLEDQPIPFPSKSSPGPHVSFSSQGRVPPKPASVVPSAPRPLRKSTTSKTSRPSDDVISAASRSPKHQQIPPASQHRYPPYELNSPPLVQVLQSPSHVPPRLPVAVQALTSQVAASRLPPVSRPHTPDSRTTLSGSASRSPTPSREVKILPSTSQSGGYHTKITITRGRSSSAPPPRRRRVAQIIIFNGRSSPYPVVSPPPQVYASKPQQIRAPSRTATVTSRSASPVPYFPATPDSQSTSISRSASYKSPSRPFSPAPPVPPTPESQYSSVSRTASYKSPSRSLSPVSFVPQIPIPVPAPESHVSSLGLTVSQKSHSRTTSPVPQLPRSVIETESYVSTRLPTPPRSTASTSTSSPSSTGESRASSKPRSSSSRVHRSPSAPPPLRRQHTLDDNELLETPPPLPVPPLPIQAPIHQPQPPLPAPPTRIDGQDDETYTSLRKAARAEGDAMRQCFDDSQKAFNAGQKGLAKDLSNQGKAHKLEMEKLNKEAADYVFRLNNVDSAPDEIDLHGLFVKEAIDFADQALVDAKRRGAPQLRIIVGKGLHSAGAVAKIKPAIEGLMVKHRLTASLDPRNAGVLIVDMDSGSLSSMLFEAQSPSIQQIAVM